jgi:hypothetical protein
MIVWARAGKPGEKKTPQKKKPEKKQKKKHRFCNYSGLFFLLPIANVMFPTPIASPLRA